MVDEAEFRVLESKVDDLEKMVKGNGNDGMYRTVIEMGKTMEALGEKIVPLSKKLGRIEGLGWTLLVAIAATAMAAALNLN